jgi:hypothetical protein
MGSVAMERPQSMPGLMTEDDMSWRWRSQRILLGVVDADRLVEAGKLEDLAVVRLRPA